MKCPGVAEYEVSFYGKWSNMTHPNAFPDMGKFSPWVGASHDMYYTMWGPGMKASKGVQEVAESGATTEIEKEIDMRIIYNRTAWKEIKAAGDTTGSGHTMGIKVEVTADYPMVSMIAMLVPSPDWFTGIMDVNLCDNGMWRDTWNSPNLQPWDAGTDDGDVFNSTNDPTEPRQNIAIINKDSGTPFKGPNAIATLGMLMFKRVNKPTVYSCSGEQKYTLEFQGMWSKERQPSGFPDGANFSPLIGCTHKYNYKFWSPLTKASPGVEDVAENGTLKTSFLFYFLTGNPDELETELKAVLIKGDYVYQVYTADDITESTASRKMEIMVKGMYSKVSFISKLEPSPDWFAGVDSVDLCGSDGWKEMAEILSPAYDAGTEDGDDFESTDVATRPQGVILQITKDSDTVMKGANDIKDFAKFTFTKYKAVGPVSPSPDPSPDPNPDPDPSPDPNSAHRPSASVSVFLYVGFPAILRFLIRSV
ncbi:hypothetical protein ACROYT_G039402 [Oculina patagonica]